MEILPEEARILLVNVSHKLNLHGQAPHVGITLDTVNISHSQTHLKKHKIKVKNYPALYIWPVSFWWESVVENNRLRAVVIFFKDSKGGEVYREWHNPSCLLLGSSHSRFFACFTILQQKHTFQFLAIIYTVYMRRKFKKW